MKILVTGADGFIGSHLVEKLLFLGFDVRAFVFYNSFNSWGWLDYIHPKNKNKIDVFVGDIRDSYCVRRAVVDCDVIVHLAALIAIPYSYYSPDSYVDTNVKGTLNILQAAKEFKLKKILITSTSEVYGSALSVPINENHPLQGQSPYSATKIAADQLSYAFYCSFNLPITIIRPFNTFGPRQSARAVIPSIITQITSGSDSVYLGALTPTRDFNYIDDTVNGFICAINSNSCNGEVINLGNNFEISIETTAKLIADIMNVNITIVCDEERLRPKNSEVDRLIADNSKALKLLNWKPNYYGIDGFKYGLEKTISWFQHSDNLKFYKSKNYNI
jgi:NAD dependent epimerase/dehydratase